MMNLVSNKNQFKTRQINKIESDYDNCKYELNVDCTKCPNFKINEIPELRYKKSFICLECLMIGINSSKDIIENIKFSNSIDIPVSDFKIIIEIYKVIEKINQLFNEYFKSHCLNCKQKKCIIKEIELSNKSPVLIYLCLFLRIYANIKIDFLPHLEQSVLNLECIDSLSEELLKISLRHKQDFFFDIIKNLYDKSLNEEEFLSYVFIGVEILKYEENADNYLSKTNYIITEFPLYSINIYCHTIEYENLYTITEKIGEKSREIYEKIKEEIKKKFLSISYEEISNIGDVIQRFYKIAANELNLKFNNLSKNEIHNLSLISSIENVQMRRIFPLLIDNYIEEIYSDGYKNSIYIDHQLYGRCRTNIILTDDEINTLKTIIRISSHKRLDEMNSSIKCTIQNNYFTSRFTVDVEPLQPKKFSLDIRKMNKKVFTLPELISEGMLSVEIAGFLFFCILNRLNITVVGETSTGKTTLINSLDIVVPKHFRKIYVEEAPESLDLSNFGFHQLKYIVDPNAPESSYSNKSCQINRLLHRNPDLIYLGEILDAEEAHAMFHCLSAGLRGFQTIHARDIISLLNRWQYHFKIDPSCFNDLDVIILLKHECSKRFINEIIEVYYEDSQIMVNTIYKYNPDHNDWMNLTPLDNLKLIKRITKFNSQKNLLKKEINFFTLCFEKICQLKIRDIANQVRIFEKISNQLLKSRNNEFDLDYIKLINEIFSNIGGDV